jgi:hypothetical protein
MSLIAIKKNFTFDHSVWVLTKAYLNGNLQNGNCAACAVGNLIADALGIRVTRLITAKDHEHYGHPGNRLIWVGAEPNWLGALFGKRDDDFADEHGYSRDEQLAATGYSLDELSSIEVAFESARRMNYFICLPAEATYQGLLAVVDVLAEIHGVDVATGKQAAAPFTREYNRLRELAA